MDQLEGRRQENHSGSDWLHVGAILGHGEEDVAQRAGLTGEGHGDVNGDGFTGPQAGVRVHGGEMEYRLNPSSKIHILVDSLVQQETSRPLGGGGFLLMAEVFLL